MTSPNRAIPEGAYSRAPGSRGITGLRSQTQQSMQSQMNGQIARVYQQIPYNFAGAVQSALHEFTASLCDAVTGLTGGLINLSGWAAGLRQQASKARTDAAAARDAALSAENAVGETTQEVHSTNSRVQVVMDGLPIKPYWDTMNITEETSVPRSLLHSRVWDVSMTAKPGYVQYSYTYVAYYDQDNNPIYASCVFYVQYAPSFTPPAATMDGAFIRCRYSGGRKVVTYLPDAVSSPCELYVVVGRMLPNGDVRIEWVSENQTPLISNQRFERMVEMPSEILFDVGETAYVGIHQRGNGNPRPLLGTAATTLPRASTAWPPRPGARFPASGSLTAGSVIAAGALNFSSDTVPYVSLGKSLTAIAPMRLTFYENFDDSILPASFVRMSNRVAAVSGGVFVVSGGDDGLRRYMYAQPLNYDNVMVTGRVISPTVRHAWLMVRSSSNNNNCVTLNITQSSVTLYHYLDDTWTTLSSVDTTVASGDEFRVKAIDAVFTAQRKTAQGWQDVFSYTDFAGALPKGPGNRYAGLGNERASWVDGGGWDYWKAEDL